MNNVSRVSEVSKVLIRILDLTQTINNIIYSTNFTHITDSNKGEKDAKRQS